MNAKGPGFTFGPATFGDLEALVALRLVVMRGSLERIGRYAPDRARARFVERYRPEHTRLIWVGDSLVGCVALLPHAETWEIEHFYLDPAHQGAGLGAAVMAALLAETGDRPVILTVVRESPANRFYPRFGFVEVGREGVDILYRRG